LYLSVFQRFLAFETIGISPRTRDSNPDSQHLYLWQDDAATTWMSGCPDSPAVVDMLNKSLLCSQRFSSLILSREDHAVAHMAIPIMKCHEGTANMQLKTRMNVEATASLGVSQRLEE